jgi:hypothetical protein
MFKRVVLTFQWVGLRGQRRGRSAIKVTGLAGRRGGHGDSWAAGGALGRRRAARRGAWRRGCCGPNDWLDQHQAAAIGTTGRCKHTTHHKRHSQSLETSGGEFGFPGSKINTRGVELYCARTISLTEKLGFPYADKAAVTFQL